MDTNVRPNAISVIGVADKEDGRVVDLEIGPVGGCESAIVSGRGVQQDVQVEDYIVLDLKIASVDRRQGGRTVFSGV